MKKSFLAMTLFAVAMSASAQVEFLYTDFGRNVICREKKLFWMEGDSDPCFNIVNYKKAGGKETFSLTPKRQGDGKYTVTITLKDDKATHIVMKGEATYTSDVNVKTESESSRELVKYFREEAGYTTPSAASAVPGKPSVKRDTPKESTEETVVKQALGKVKGLFKKKK